MTFYKAIRPDSHAFAARGFIWPTTPGEVCTHPAPGDVGDTDAIGYLSVSTVPTDCVGMSWPARLLIVEPGPGAEVWTPKDDLPNKRAAHAWKVIEERPAHELLGPQGEHLAALLDRLTRLTPPEALAIAAARDAAGAAAWAAARDAARDAAGAAAWAAAGAAAGLLVRDCIDDATYVALTWPLAGVLGPLHPDDDPVPLCVHDDGWEHPIRDGLLPCTRIKPSWWA